MFICFAYANNLDLFCLTRLRRNPKNGHFWVKAKQSRSLNPKNISRQVTFFCPENLGNCFSLSLFSTSRTYTHAQPTMRTPTLSLTHTHMHILSHSFLLDLI